MATKQQKRIKALEALIDDGLTIPEALYTFALRQPERAKQLAEEARAKFEDEGTLEFDDRPIVSENDEGTGAYVMCWAWIGAESLD